MPKHGKGRGQRLELWQLENAKEGERAGDEEGGVGSKGSGGNLLDKLSC